MRTCSLITAGEKLSEGLARSTFPATCRRDWPRGTNDSYVRLGLPPDERGWHGEGLRGHRDATGFPALVSTRGSPPSLRMTASFFCVENGGSCMTSGCHRVSAAVNV